MSTTPLRYFRLVCKEHEITAVESLLLAEGYIFVAEVFSPWARRLLYEPIPLGRSLAAFFGLIYIQDRSSMLPPLILQPIAGSCVLDMCASPGSKTGLLGQLVGPAGFVLGNEPSRTRYGTLRRNLAVLNLLSAGVCSFAGEQIPLADGGTEDAPDYGWEYIQLDPPCSGWGTVEKNPKVMDLWHGDKVRPLIALQRILLRKASTLLRVGGRVVYSTCTTNIAENEEQVHWACEELGFELETITAPLGFTVLEPLRADCQGTLRVGANFGSGANGSAAVSDSPSEGQGFFIASLKKVCASHARRVPLPDALRIENALAPSSLESLGCLPELLPAGEVALYGDTVHFVPHAALQQLPHSFPWHACVLAKNGKHTLRALPRLRVLMPSLAQAAERGLPVVSEDDPKRIHALLSGQSLQLPSPAREAGLYWQDLALGRLRTKGARALWSEA